MKQLTTKTLHQLKTTFYQGLRVRLIKMEDTQAPPLGTKGTVLGVDDIGSICVVWDNGSHLSVVYGEDKCQLVITEKLQEQIEKVRQTGKTNMLDTKAVQYIANQMNLYELVIFLEDEKEEYIHYLFHQK